MKNKDNNIIDKFLTHYDIINANNDSVQYQKVYKKPSRFKCIMGFIFSLLTFIFLLSFFVFKFMYFIILLFNLIILTYYSLNLFTEKGIGFPNIVPIKNIDDSSKNDLTSDKQENILGNDEENNDTEVEKKDPENSRE